MCRSIDTAFMCNRGLQLTLFAFEIGRPHVPLRAATTPPLLPLGRQPKAWPLQLAALALLVADVQGTKAPRHQGTKGERGI